MSATATSGSASASARRERAWPWIEGGVLALVVLALLVLGGEAVRASYHGYLHVTLGEAVLRDGLRPENPYHAGAPLRYYTLYPALGALLGRCGLGPLWGFAALNVFAALLLGPALDALGQACRLSFVARRAAFLAATFGFNALGWTGFLVVDATRFGSAPVYALQPLCFGGHPFGWDARLHAFLPKFLNVSSFALALPFALWALSAGFEERSRGRIVLAGLMLGLATALNPLAGGVAAVALAVSVAPDFVRGAAGVRGAWSLAAVGAALVSVPFLLPALAPAPRGPSLTGNPNLGGTPIANLLGPIALLFPIALVGFARLARAARWRVAFAACVCAVLVLVGEMPQGNEYKMERMLALVLALPAGEALGTWWAAGGFGKRKALAALVVALPTTALAAWAYVAYGAHGAELPLVVDARGRLAPAKEVPSVPAALLALTARSDARAVIVTRLDEDGTRAGTGLVQGNALAPALDRPLFVDLPQIHNEGQADLGRRLDLVAALYQGEAFVAADDRVRTSAAALAELRAVLPDRPILALTHEGRDAGLERALDALGARRLGTERGFSLRELPPLATAAREER
ncbi:MAG: hypothetical protein U1F29_18470 [Planctomycetota bacterium]